MKPKITIATLMAGRYYSLEAYLWGLSVIDYPKDKIELLWSSNSNDQTFHEKALKEQHKLKGYASKTYTITNQVKSTRNAFLENGKYTIEHARGISKLYNNLWQEIKTEWVLFLEDDVIAPSNAMDLLDCYKKNIGYACGVVMDRHGNSVFVFDLIKEKFKKGLISRKEADLPEANIIYKGEIVKKPWGKREVGLGHFGLTLLKKSVVEKLDKPYFKSDDKKHGGKLVGCDMVYCVELDDLKIKRICDFNIRGIHISSDGKIH